MLEIFKNWGLQEDQIYILWTLVGISLLMLPVFLFSLLHIQSRKREIERLARKKEKKSYVRFKTISVGDSEIEGSNVLSQKKMKKRVKKR